MANITKRQTISLLKKVQKFLCEVSLRFSTDIQTYIDDENGRLWFVYNVKERDDKYISGHCYEWRTYTENLKVFEKFMSDVNNI